MVLVCAPGHRLASLGQVRLEDLDGVDMIAFDADLEIRHEIDRALAARGIEVRVMMEFDNTETIKRAIEIDAGVSLLPEPTVAREVNVGALVARPLVGVNLKRPIGIIQRRGMELGKTASRFMQLLLKQSSSGREIADLADSDREKRDRHDAGPIDSLTDECDAVAAKPLEAATRAAS